METVRATERPVFALTSTFEDCAAFSTMHGKAHMTGSSGGVFYTRDETLFRRARAYADRGNPSLPGETHWRDPARFLFPALNVPASELGCAIGLASLARLPDTIARRHAFLRDLRERLSHADAACSLYPFDPDDSPYFCPIVPDLARLTCSVVEFASALLVMGHGVKPRYRLLVADWPFIGPHLADTFEPINARATLDLSFNLDFHEQYGATEAVAFTQAVGIAQAHYRRDGFGGPGAVGR